MTFTLRTLDQARIVADRLEAGWTNQEIDDELGVTAPRISHIRRALPELRPYLNVASPSNRLSGHREQLVSLRREALILARQIGRDLRALDEELEAAQVDRILGLRAVS